MPFECDVNVLGKFFALQSLLHAAPDEKWMGNVLCRGTVEVPGLCSVALYLEGEQVAYASSPTFPVQWPQICPADPASLEFSSVTMVRRFSLRTPRENFGYFFIAIIHPEKFNPYLAHLENTLSLVSLVLETKHQNVLLKESSSALESKVAERTEALEERESHIRLLLDSAAEAIYGLDKDGQCTFCNKSCIEMLGYASEADLLGKNMHELIHHTKSDGSLYALQDCKIFKSFLTGEKIYCEEEVLWRADGTSFAAEYWSHPILDDGQTIGAVVTFIDISARKEAERELRRHQNALSKAQEIGHIGTWELDLTNDVLLWTDECCRIFGVPPGSKADYKTFIDKVHPDDRDYVEQKWSAAVNGEAYDIEHRLLIDGKVSWVREKADLTFDENGRPIYAIGVAQEITDHKRSQKMLEDSESKFRTLYLESPLPYHSLDENGDFIAVNPAWLSLLGYEEADVLGKNYGNFLHPEWKNVFETKFPQFKKYGRVQEVYFKIRHKDGHYLDISLDGCISTNADGSFNRTNCVFSDITEQKKLESEQLFLKRRLEALWNISKLIDVDLKTISDHILKEIVDMTASPYGFYGFVNDSEDEMAIYSWSEKAMTDCEIHSSPLSFPIDQAGIWGNAVRDKAPFLLNDYNQDCENKRGVPEGHVALTRVLAVPVVMTGKVVAVGAVANKSADYTNEDISQLESFLSSVQLIIGRKKMEEALKEREEHYRVLFHQAPHGSAVADAETGVIIECNEQLAKFVGRPVEELIGQPQSILHPHNPEAGRVTKNFERHQAEMEGQILEDQLIDKDGNIIDVEINATRMTLNGRDVLHGFVYDISERKKMFEEYRRSAQLAALGTVAAGVAHEINNPIQGIMNYATIIEKTPGQDDRTIDIARRISTESERIAEITRELLDFAKDNRKKSECCDFREVIESAIDLIEKKTIRRGISIETTYDENLPKAQIYRQGIQQIIINLIDNSCDAIECQEIPPDKKIIKVSCSLVEREAARDICMEISDLGMGMSEETLQRATETFYSTKPSTKGTGLGLSIVNDIVNKHNGTMSIESSEGEYTKVKICLPVENDEEARKTE